MRCPDCQHENRPDRRFCAECGHALEPKCPACGTRNRPGEKFCGECGAGLASAPAPAAAEPRASGPPAPQALAGGRYVVRRFLGEGSRKRVYLAHDTRLDRDVAIALIKTDGLDEAALARVRREARAMGRLGDHPNVVTVHDVGEEDGRPYIVSQHMGGGAVDGLLRRAEGHRLPIPQAMTLAEQVSRALEYAHARGIVHRDLKPGNVWLTEDGTAKLGDFGLALSLDRSRLTIDGMMVGTVAYMPPEQALGRPAEARSDLYALGAMLYEMVTGRPPFLGDDAVSVISQHINTPPVAPSWHNADVPRALEALILRLLAKAPEDRPEHATVVRQALAAVDAPTASSVERAAHVEANPLDRLASGIFVGRDHEMDALRAALEETLSGHGRLVLLVGEPGIGKTRTSEELATYARLRKAQVLWGRCYDGEGAPAYWPWVQAIRAYVHEREPQGLLSELGSAAAAIAQVVSEVRERLPGLPEPPSLTPEQARFRLFDGVTTFLRNAARTQPLVLVLDDLHWADKPSLLLLQFLAKELRGTRLLVIGTYRDVEVRRQHPLAQTLGELTRENLAQRIVLRGLTAHDVARFIEITAGLKPPAPLVEAVYKETEGNPFFVNEVVRLLVTEGRLAQADRVKSWSVSIPQSVRDVVGRRLDRLSPECNRLLTMGAVIGREFGADVLVRVSGLAEDRVLEVLEEAVAARVLGEVPRAPARYVFTHALIRETLREELTTTRRLRLHQQIGEALEALYGRNPDPHLAELAYHFCEAAQAGGDVDKAVGYAVRAGNRAADLMAHEEAARQYELALQALELREPRAEAHHCELLLTLSDTLWRAGEFARAKEVALQAAEIARRREDAEPFARAALAFAGPLLAFAAVNRDEELVALLEGALATLGPMDNPLRARVLARLAEEVAFSDACERRESLCQEAAAMARRLGDPGVLASVLRATHWAIWVPESLEARRALADELVTLSEASGDRAMALEGRWLRVCDLLELGDVPAAARDIEACSRLAEELRQPYHSWLVAIFRVLLAFARGQLTDVEPLAERALEIGQEGQNQNASLVFGLHTMVLQRERGVDEWSDLVEGFATTYRPLEANLRCARALGLFDAGRLDEARAEFGRLAADDFRSVPRTVAWLYSFAFLAEVCHALGDAAGARILYARLAPFAGRSITIGPVLAFGSADRYLGLLAATMGRVDDAVRHLEAAMTLNARMGTLQALARTQVELADQLLDRDAPGDRTRALELVNAGLDGAQRLGMRRVVERALGEKLRAQGIVTRDVTVSIDAVAELVQRERPDLRSHVAPDGTVTLLFTDLEGSTALTERLGDAGAQELLRIHNRLIRDQVAANHGFEVKALGDGFMVAFQSARRGLRCALGIARAFAAHNVAHSGEPLRVRIGLHTGEAIREDDDFFGRTVIQAARIAGAARGGEILVSSLFRELTATTGEVTFDGGREVELKGLGTPHRVFSVNWESAA
jgi:class 3 adenylate cyclase